MSAQNIANQEAALAARGWTTVNAFTAIPAPTGAASTRPIDAVPPAEQEEAVRRTCVRQVWVGSASTENDVQKVLPARFARYAATRDVEAPRSSLPATFDSAFVGTGGDIAALINAVVMRRGGSNTTIQARAGQLADFLRDWNRWSETVRTCRPQFGSTDDYLRSPSTAVGVALRIFGPSLAAQLHGAWAVADLPAPTSQDLESFLGASLDAYVGCVEDGRKQLRTKWETWEQEQAAAPRFAAAAREFLVRECRQEAEALDKLKADRATLEQQLTRAQQALTQATTAPALASQPLVLNPLGCVQR